MSRYLAAALMTGMACWLAFAGTAAGAQTASAIQATLEKAETTMLEDPRAVAAASIAARRVLERQSPSAMQARLLAKALWLEGEASGRLGDTPAAERALSRAHAIIRATEPGGLLHARITMSQGATAFDKGEVQKAFTGFRDAFALFAKLKDTRGQALALQSMGLIYIDAGDYQRALRYFSQSAEVHPSDRNLTMSAFNNQGLAFREMGQLDAAARDYSRGLTLAREVGSGSYEVTMLANLADVELVRGRIASASRYAELALAAGRARAAEMLPLAWGIKARIAWARGDAADAVAMLPRVFGQTKVTDTNYQFRAVHQMASEAYRKTGDPGAAFAHLQAVNRLDAEAREIRSSANAALMAAQFDYSSQELRIAKRDAALATSRARTQWIMLGASLLLLAASLIAFFWIRRSRNETRAVNVQLNKALAAKSEFLATTSHEIRTPLNGIMGMTQVLLHTGGVAPEVRERIALIDGAGKAMKAIVDDLLDMAKIEAGEVLVERSDVALPRLIEDTVRLWTAEAESKGIAIVAETSDAPALIVEDERKLRQILFNLVSNAVKFTDQGRITVRAQAADDRLIVSVEDSGAGIPADQLDAIFGAFHQVDGATTRQHSGTGLGLSISSKLAGALGGQIDVESEPGRGSTFTLKLPLTLAAALAVDEDHDGAVTLLDARVLLLDRNPLFQSLAGAALEGAIASLTTADSFADALGKGQFDLLIVDEVTLGEAPLDILADAVGTTRVLRLVAPGEATEGRPDVVAKQMPPLNIAPALETLLTAAPQARMAA